MESEVSYMGKGENAQEMTVNQDDAASGHMFNKTIDDGSDFSNNKNANQKVIEDSD